MLTIIAMYSLICVFTGSFVAVVVVEGHSAKSVAFASATVSFVNLDITPK